MPLLVSLSKQLNFPIHLLLIKRQALINSVQSLSHNGVILGMANVISWRLPKGYARSRGNGIINK